MENPTSKPNTEAFDKWLAERKQEKYILRLYVAGNSPKSQRALIKIKNICENYLKGRYELEVIDIYQQPEMMEEEQIVAIPTLIKKLPPPLQKFVGDMANTEKIMVGLDIFPSE